ncbi:MULTISPECIES: RNA polymerase sigma factor [unclassified Paenibacillus]|uniref:RNA polymerase sigma factor n=1 Tax=unclassified Paenibacillus TaxID=185978 RepID=UPI002407287D|nr:MULTISPECIES: RNA polymerase sigma factor [unclassified Paenibacillus]MDF9843299.1 RNA polymerase sigma factor (sigma-70 family) [Paenibacillus sp. PastF-2]MDF9849887.1 RNA polymerase sigma factor (sigma-70 family) [Paenibacillus sp. PastM-2]MDF9856595.1 RNA polymerase sigma factor (sigma-70 family) [Paenibacillus sp. PastF-1]MDH6481864.1 RNA polymerase sigma factor (sigma-70 family) [Paenibacillus sp. PastH-2]MDH6509048.1 RNA polymerase sigma factor (sigma-70 family) [Paenibacillus sp. Pas
MQSNRELFEAYSKAVYRTCYYMVQDAADAEDLCQEVFITVFRSQWQNVEHTRAWIMKIAVNTSLNHLKRSSSLRQKLVQNLHLWGGGVSEEPVERLVEQKETAQEWARYMSRLPAKIRAVLTLRYMHDFSLAEISEALSIPVGTAKSRQHKGIKMMKEILAEAGIKDEERRDIGHEETGTYAGAAIK